MKKKIFSTLVLAGLFAFGAHAETFEGGLTIGDAVIAPGGTATLSVQVKNNIPVRGFDFKMFLPEGVTVTGCTMNEDRFPEGNIALGGAKLEEDGGYRIAYAIQEQVTFSGTSGEIASIKIKADESVAERKYKVELKDVYLFDIADAAPMYSKETDEFTLTVAVPNYTEGYAVEILPFAYNGNVKRQSILLANKTAITNIEFDIEVPSYFSEISLCKATSSLDDLEFTTEIVTNSNTMHVTIESNDPEYFIAEGNENAIASFNMVKKTSGVTTGVYPITITNIQMTDADGVSYLAEPYTTEIFVGTSPKVTVTNGVAAFHGNYGGADEYALLTAALPEGATIDLTKVSAMNGDPTSLKMNNVFVTNDVLAYGRTLANEWGTLCLPFAVETSDDFQIYEMVAASSEALTFEKVTSAAANTPLLFRAKGSDISLQATNDGTFDVNDVAQNPTSSMTTIDRWEIFGSFINQSIDVSSLQVYALSDGEFHKVLSKLNVAAFHAWLQNNGDSMAATFRIFDGTEGIQFIEQEDGTVKLIYDLQGRSLKSGEHQQMRIENGRKVISVNK